MKDIKINSVLFPTDFSAVSKNALNAAMSICIRQNATLNLLHVLKKDNLHKLPSLTKSLEYEKQEVINILNDKIKEISQTLGQKGKIHIEAKIEIGETTYVISQVAKQNNYDLIVMGTRYISRIREFFLGSKAFEVIKYAPCPVLTIPENWKKNSFSKILFPIRLIPGAIEKYDFIKPILEKNNSEMIVVGLTDFTKPENSFELKYMLELLKNLVEQDDIIFSTTLHPFENTAGQIIELANLYDADLIVITVNADYQWSEFFKGSYSQNIVNHSKRPVLSIRSDLINSHRDNSFESLENEDKY